MVSPTRWTWIWVNSGSWWWTGRPGVLQIMGSQRVGHNWETELNVRKGLPWWLRQWRTCLQCRRTGFDPWVGTIPWRREWQPTPVFLSGEFQGQRSLADYSPWGHRESDTTEWLTQKRLQKLSIQAKVHWKMDARLGDKCGLHVSWGHTPSFHYFLCFRIQRIVTTSIIYMISAQKPNFQMENMHYTTFINHLKIFTFEKIKSFLS